jgi:hypothetical protein
MQSDRKGTGKSLPVTSLMRQPVTKLREATRTDDPRVRGISVRPHNLADYEQLTRKDSHERLPEAIAEPDRDDPLA